MYFTQTWYSLSGKVVENAIYNSAALRAFFSWDRNAESAPGATTSLKFPRLLETNGSIQRMVVVTNAMPPETGLPMCSYTVVDATIITGPLLTKNAEHKRDDNTDTGHHM
jgi:IS5 family transposase